jgi:hypothetical protein
MGSGRPMGPYFGREPLIGDGQYKITHFVACHGSKSKRHSNRSDFNSYIDLPDIYSNCLI